MNIEKQTTTDYFEDIAFHPSLDIKKEILVLGFRIKPEMNKEENLFVIVSGNEVQVTKEPVFAINGSTHHIDVKGRKLAKLSKQWNKADLDNYRVELFENLKGVVPQAVFQKLVETLRKHVELDEPDYTIISAWIIGTYFFPIFAAYPYLHIKAPKGSGKTQCLSFLNQTCFNAVKARASLPAMRDTVDSLRGTYLMDQADALRRPNMEDFLDILTDSYKRGGGDVRKMVADKGKNWSLEEFQAYSPKGFASIHPLPEDLRDRCIIISLTRSGKNFHTLNEEDQTWKELRGELYKLLITYFQEIDMQYQVKTTSYRLDPSLVGRELELWIPLEVLMERFGVSMFEQKEAKERFLSQYGFAEAQVNDLERQVIELIQRRIGGELEITLAPKEIAENIDSLWFEDADSAKQQAAEVGKIISKFNLSSRKLPRSNKGERYVFSKEKVEKIYHGYFTQEEASEHAPTYTDEKEPETTSGLFVNAERV